jgi:hypothetical protein
VSNHGYRQGTLRRQCETACGRILYPADDTLQEAASVKSAEEINSADAARINEKTAHRKGVKIAIMD